MPALAISGGVTIEVGDAGAGHREAADLLLHGDHHRVRVGLDRGGGEVAVEQLVQVLVGADPLHHLVADRVAEQGTGVAVRDPGRQLLAARGR